MEYTFSDLVNLDRFKELLQSFHAATHIPVGVVAPDNRVLLEVGWQSICVNFFRANPQTNRLCQISNQQILDALKNTPVVSRRCENGLYDYAVPIRVDGQAVATLILGQVLHEAPDEAWYREQARRVGFAEDAFMEALRQIPILPVEQVHSLIAYLTHLGELLTSIGLEKQQAVAAGEQLRQSEERLRHLLENSPMGIVVSDAQGEITFANHYAEQTLGITHASENLSALHLPDWRNAGDNGRSLRDVLNTREPVSGVRLDLENEMGQSAQLKVNAAPLGTDEGRFDGAMAILENVSEREKSEQIVQRQNAYLLALSETTLNLLNRFDPNDLLNDIAARVSQLLGTPDVFLYLVEPSLNRLVLRVGRGIHQNCGGGNLEIGEGLPGEIWQSGESLLVYDDPAWQGRVASLPIELARTVVGVPLMNDKRVIGVIGASFPEVNKELGSAEMDILERFGQQASLALHNTQLYYGLEQELTERRRVESALRQSEDKFSKAFHISPDAICISRMRDGVFIEVNEGFQRLTGFGLEEVLGKRMQDLEIFDEPDLCARLIETASRGEEIPGMEVHLRPKHGTERIGLIAAREIEIDGEKCLLSVIRDITERKQTEVDLRNNNTIMEMRLKRLYALRNIDLAITSGTDLQSIIHEILRQVKDSLGVDGAVISVPTPEGSKLLIAAAEGLDAGDVILELISIDAPYLDRVYQNSESVFLEDVKAAREITPTVRFRKPVASYAATPMPAKSRVKGILEAFTYQPTVFDAEWRAFFQSLAMQTAIAIDNAELFYRMEMANIELSDAYDKTIEGWARALELRDKETKGHSDRVTTLTIRLARRMGIPEEDIPHLRRGVFLHDIGKMGIPDAILNKPGPLTESEWEIMRLHPRYANDMLAEIPYLKPAQNIAFSHHEKWDGTGYPRGLKGVEIPVGARIFSVVDVWDALLSDRPYRPAWTVEQTREYILNQSGKHFDPEVVKAFLEMMNEDNEVELE